MLTIVTVDVRRVSQEFGDLWVVSSPQPLSCLQSPIDFSDLDQESDCSPGGDASATPFSKAPSAWKTGILAFIQSLPQVSSKFAIEIVAELSV